MSLAEGGLDMTLTSPNRALAAENVGGLCHTSTNSLRLEMDQPPLTGDEKGRAAYNVRI